jgi:hypothetical protein
MIEQHEMQPADTDQVRWKRYGGKYGMTGWGVLDPAYAQVYPQDSHLYIKTKDEAYPLRLVEVSPGLFFATNGETLDFRGPIPTWRNIKLIRVGTGPSLWQQIILAICALIFLSGLLFFPLRGLIRRIRRTESPAKPASRWAILTPFLVILTSLFGLLSIGMIAAIPTIIYSGFLGWLDLPLWQRLLAHTPFALLVTGVGLLILNVPAWRNAWWSRGEKIYYLAFAFASVAIITLLGYWRLIGLNLG